MLIDKRILITVKRLTGAFGGVLLDAGHNGHWCCFLTDWCTDFDSGRFFLDCDEMGCVGSVLSGWI